MGRPGWRRTRRAGALVAQRKVAQGIEPALRACNLTKVYRTGEVEVHALRGVSLELYPADMVALVGPSGSGKSTLLNILGGLDRASSGETWFGDRQLTTLDDRALTLYRRAHVGFVFQFYNLIPSLTATENVALVTEIAPDPMVAEEALEIVGLGNRLNHFPAQLSGGEQQRVAIARAIAKRPELMLCDEPTGALDSETGILVLEAIEQIHAELGTTTVLITHNAVIADMTDRVLIMRDGHIVEERKNANKRRARDLRW